MNSEVKEITTNAIKYWEKYRVLYNLILIIPAYLGYSFADGFPMPDSPEKASGTKILLDLVILCIGANFCYTFAYIPDFFVQMSDFKEGWRKNRILLFAFGTLFASYLAFINAMMLPWGIQWI